MLLDHYRGHAWCIWFYFTNSVAYPSLSKAALKNCIIFIIYNCYFLKKPDIDAYRFI